MTSKARHVKHDVWLENVAELIYGVIVKRTGGGATGYCSLVVLLRRMPDSWVHPEFDMESK